MLRFTLDPNGTPSVVENPVGWDEMRIIIERDKALNGILLKHTTEVKFLETGYTYLVSQIDSNGFCGTVEVLIEQECNGVYSTLLEGVIPLDKCIIDSSDCTVQTIIEDSSLFGLISRNKDAKLRLDTANLITGNTTPSSVMTLRDVTSFTRALGS